MFNPLEPIRRFWILPSILVGGILLFAWHSAPWGAFTKLHKTEAKLVKVTGLKDTYAAWTKAWKANYDSLNAEHEKLKVDAAKALTESNNRQTQSNKAAYQSGVIMGRAIERRRHAQGVDTDPATGANDDVVCVDFRELWSSGSAPNNCSGEGVSTGSRSDNSR